MKLHAHPVLGKGIPVLGQCFLVHLPLEANQANKSEASLTLVFTNWPDKSEVIQVLELQGHYSLRNLVKKSNWPTNRVGRRVFGEIMIESVQIVNNNKRGT